MLPSRLRRRLLVWIVSAFDHILAVVEYAFRDVLAYAQASQLSPPCATQIVRADCVDPDLLEGGEETWRHCA
jgi:hypothetical protein